MDPDMEADIRTDIMDWDYRSYPPGSFDVIWSSPPCAEHSRAKTIGVRKLDDANGIVKRTLETVDYFNPSYWIMEIPQTGLLKSQPFAVEPPYNDLDYCKYGMPYRNRTRLRNNIESWTPRPLCKKDCDHMVGNIHEQCAQRGPPQHLATVRRRHLARDL